MPSRQILLATICLILSFARRVGAQTSHQPITEDNVHLGDHQKPGAKFKST
jgi:hypothetical protein